MEAGQENKFLSISWRQLVLLAVGYLVVSVIGAMLITPTGLGSDRIVYVCLLIYSVCVMPFCSKLTRVIAVLLAILFIAGIFVETKARQDYQERLRENFDRRKASLQTSPNLHSYSTHADTLA